MNTRYSKRRFSIEQKERLKGYLYLLPVFLIFAVIIFIPAIKSFFESFSDSSLYTAETTFIGMSNYREITSQSDFWVYFFRTIWMVFIVVVLQYIFGLILALLMNLELPGTRWMKNFIMLPWVVPIAAMVVMFNWMSQTDYGLFNMLLSSIGLDGQTRYWIGDMNWAFPMVVMMHVWRNMPFYAITLYAALKNIPDLYYEAASIDGAGKFSQFWNITLPQIKYPSMIVITLHVLFTVNNFDIIYLSTGGGPVGKTEVLATQVYQTAWTNYEYGLASAIGVMMMLIMVVFTIIYMRILKEE